jgi:hypothetical protein
VHGVNFHDTFAIERSKVLAVARSSDELCNEVLYPSIIKIHRDTLRKKDKLAVCIRQHKNQGEVTCILQLEFKQQEGNPGEKERSSISPDRGSNSPSPAKSGKKSKRAPSFAPIDETILRFIGMFLQMRFEKHFLVRDARNKLKDREDTISMISRFLKLKTYKSFMMGIHRELRPFFGFKEIGILFFDREKDKFFTLQFDDLNTL